MRSSIANSIKIGLLQVFSLCIINYAIAQESFYQELADSAITLTHTKVQYDPEYYTLDYPNGDVPSDKGVCTDVIVRAYRKLGIDLQKEIHEDMKANFEKYPKNWGLSSTDRNIDHRRVPNLMEFFKRKGKSLKITKEPHEYKPGDIICWELGNGLTHIGILVDKKSKNSKRNLVVHNIGLGQVLEDCLFDYKIIGHFRYNKLEL